MKSAFELNWYGKESWQIYLPSPFESKESRLALLDRSKSTKPMVNRLIKLEMQTTDL